MFISCKRIWHNFFKAAHLPVDVRLKNYYRNVKTLHGIYYTGLCDLTNESCVLEMKNNGKFSFRHPNLYSHCLCAVSGMSHNRKTLNFIAKCYIQIP